MITQRQIVRTILITVEKYLMIIEASGHAVYLKNGELVFYNICQLVMRKKTQNWLNVR